MEVQQPDKFRISAVAPRGSNASREPSSSGGPAQSPDAAKASDPSSAGSSSQQLPSWMSVWAKPTVASGQLHDGQRIRDFVARPLPASSARKRFGARSSSGESGPQVGDLSPCLGMGGGGRPASAGRAGLLASEMGLDAVGWIGGGAASGGGASVLLHFMRGGSANGTAGGCGGGGGLATGALVRGGTRRPPGYLMGAGSAAGGFDPAMALGSTSHGGFPSGGSGSLGGTAAWGWAARTVGVVPGSRAGRPPSAPASSSSSSSNLARGGCNSVNGFGGSRNGGCSGGGSGSSGSSSAQLRPLSAGPRRTPMSGQGQGLTSEPVRAPSPTSLRQVPRLARSASQGAAAAAAEANATAGAVTGGAAAKPPKPAGSAAAAARRSGSKSAAPKSSTKRKKAVSEPAAQDSTPASLEPSPTEHAQAAAGETGACTAEHEATDAPAMAAPPPGLPAEAAEAAPGASDPQSPRPASGPREAPAGPLQPPATPAGRQRHCTALQFLGLGPLDEDLGRLVDERDMLLAARTPGGGADTQGLAAVAPPQDAAATASTAAETPAAAAAGRGTAGQGGGGDAAAAATHNRHHDRQQQQQQPALLPHPVHVPQAQHMLLSGSLQELWERLQRSGERDLHLSLASITFAGELDSSAGDVILIRNRTVILHNCTLAFRPGQRLCVGFGGHLILADVNIAAVGSTEICSPGAGPSPRPRSLLPPRHQRQDGGDAAPGTPKVYDRLGLGTPMLHATDGGRLLLRGCRVKLSTSAISPEGDTAAGTAPDGGTSPTSPRPDHYLRHVRLHHHPSVAATATATATASVRSDVPGQEPALCVLADGGAAVEAVGCRLWRCAAAGAGTCLTLRRCSIKPGRPSSSGAATATATVAAAPGAAAPLVIATDGAAVDIALTDIRDGPLQGVAARGAGTRVRLSQTAVLGCRGHGVMLAPGAAMAALSCRFNGNGAAGLCVRGRGTAADVADSELSGNSACNLWVAVGAAVSLSACTAAGSTGGCGALVEGWGSRLLARSSCLDGNTGCGVRVVKDGALELRDCSASGNILHGVELEGTVDVEEAAERLAEALLAGTPPPPPPLPKVFCLISGGQLAKNGGHGCAVKAGGGLRVEGCELSQNGGDGGFADGPGCELLLDGCRAMDNGESGLFVCSGAAGWAEGCRLGGNMHGDLAVGGFGSRGRLVQCTFEYNPLTAVRVHMGAKVALRGCTMEPRPATGPASASARSSQRFLRLRGSRGRKLQPQAERGDAVAGEGCEGGGGAGGNGDGADAGADGGISSWTVGSVRSQCVQLRGRGSVLMVDGQTFFPLEQDLEEDDEAAAMRARFSRRW